MLLLDTQILLWWFFGERRLHETFRAAIDDDRNLKLVSAASVWEISIKRNAGRLKVPEDFPQRVLDYGFEALPVSFDHAYAAGALPRHHADPFDRMLVAQAQAERLTMVTADHKIASYDVAVLPAMN